MKKFLSHFVRIIVDILLFFKSPTDSSRQPKTLLIKDDAIGDFLVSTGALKTLTSFFSQKSEVYCLVDKKVAGLAEIFIDKEKLISVDKEKFENSVSYRFKFFKKLRCMNFQFLVASSTRSTYCDQTASRISCEKKWALVGETSRQKKRASIYTDIIEVAECPHVNLPVEAVQKEILLLEGVLGRLSNQKEYWPQIPTEKLLPISEKNYFVLLPDAGDKRRTWKKSELYIWALEKAQEKGLKCFVLSAFRDENPILLDPSFENKTGKTNLLESLSYIRSAQFAVAHETGLGHATWMIGTPLLMIMGGGYFKEFTPNAPRLNIVAKEMPCFNCHWNCIYPTQDRFPCVEQLKLEDLDKALRQLITK
ncbi:MAG: glycosyltransferase family 9 protein [Pseudobdellovibrionaceae bacterium]